MLSGANHSWSCNCGSFTSSDMRQATSSTRAVFSARST
jgi:hypothetical protein